MLDRSGTGGRRMKKAVTLGQRKPGRIGPEGVAEADAAETEAKVHSFQKKATKAQVKDWAPEAGMWKSPTERALEAGAETEAGEGGEGAG